MGAKKDHKEEREEERTAVSDKALTHDGGGGFHHRNPACWCSPEQRLLRAQEKRGLRVRGDGS